MLLSETTNSDMNSLFENYVKSLVKILSLFHTPLHCNLHHLYCSLLFSFWKNIIKKNIITVKVTKQKIIKVNDFNNETSRNFYNN